MQKSRILFTMFVLLGLVLSACQAATPQPTATVVLPTATSLPHTLIPATATTEPPILDLVDSNGSSQSFTFTELHALPSTQGQAGIKSSTGKITLPALFTGVALKDFVTLIPGFDDTMGLSVEASDGYAITFSYDQIMNGSFVQYDPGTGDELKNPFPLTAMLAYEMDGKPLDPQEDGHIRLVIVSQEPQQVTDGHWSVKYVTKLVVKPLSQDWSLHLEGTINELMDRGTFESGASPDCHGMTWTDDKAQEWVGIPLWLLIGRVDDDIKHEGPAFNDAMADAGYTVDIVASDGYTVTLESARIKRNNNILVAYLVNGNPLPEKYFPLRLVGSDLQKNEMVGMIAKIVLNLAGSPATEITPSAPAEPTQATTPQAGNILVTGLVENPLNLSEADLRALVVVKLTLEHPKKGPVEYEGVRLNDLLTLAKVKTGATKLVLTASDGFTTEVFLAEVQACADCLLSFTADPGVYALAMPGLPSNTWVKGIVQIDVQ